MTAFGSKDVAIEAMKRGAYDYLSKPFEADELILLLRKAEERERLFRENQSLARQVRSEGRSPTLPLAILSRAARGCSICSARYARSRSSRPPCSSTANREPARSW